MKKGAALWVALFFVVIIHKKTLLLLNYNVKKT